MIDETEPIRVIVVDDHDLLRKGLRDLLTEHGLRVVGEAGDGDDAVRLVAHAAPDVVIMDLNLPGISGAEATKRILEQAPEVRVLVLTISTGSAELVDALLAGAPHAVGLAKRLLDASARPALSTTLELEVIAQELSVRRLS
jgi:DNA-binding NarL/FixJ family response regulator